MAILPDCKQFFKVANEIGVLASHLMVRFYSSHYTT